MKISELQKIFEGGNKCSQDYKSKRALIEIGSKLMSFLGLEERLYK